MSENIIFVGGASSFSPRAENKLGLFFMRISKVWRRRVLRDMMEKPNMESFVEDNYAFS